MSEASTVNRGFGLVAVSASARLSAAVSRFCSFCLFVHDASPFRLILFVVDRFSWLPFLAIDP
jgi:hypothetical protein